MTNQPKYSILIGLLLASFMGHGLAQNKGISSSLAYEQITAKPIVLEGGPKTILGQDFKYPTGVPLIKAFDIFIPAGKQTSLHSHAVPLYAYVVSGELEIDYGSKGKRAFKSGTSFIEAMDWCHIGKSLNNQPVRLIGVYLGQENPNQIAPTDCKKPD
jgi:quercetin dioxygenase-like cupin family protein